MKFNHFAFKELLDHRQKLLTECRDIFIFYKSFFSRYRCETIQKIFDRQKFFHTFHIDLFIMEANPKLLRERSTGKFLYF